MTDSAIYTFVLSQILGIYLLTSAILILSRIDFYRQVIQNLKANDSVILFSASFGLLLGLALVDTHNIWSPVPRACVTVICWFILIKSILWLTLTDKMLAFNKKLFAGRGYYFVVIAMMILGFFLTWRGFFLYVEHHLMPLGQHL